ncbi:DEAD/DEAH box helicase [Nonomuraea angiospora]|uniref:DEAD/DEAH box helicase domain-containing protein n=1 Tax=Nonomuraea angiospora TaxID=46172 RepID=A0ABR9M8X4_9ACTN|nr:DEAD/DEAH box helicase [Nonomuraea angiospora]MBE1589367.1 DEAD/DEAH box helicase domain-containing protein [Nonomuraea angiospora]
MIISTGTASGKSLAYLTPAVASCLDGGTILYLTPTKALAADQLRGLRELRITQLRAACFDGDTPFEERTWVRKHANYVLTNPDMLHRSILPRHAQWSSFFRRLRMVVVDECHGYRGVFGSHVAQILRRLRRVCARYGSRPTFLLASATASEPGAFGMRLTGLEMDEVTVDASPKGSTTIALWEPPLTELRGEGGAPVRRTATAEAADLLADLVLADVRTLAFVRSRRGAETVALTARAKLADVAFSLSTRHPRPATRHQPNTTGTPPLETNPTSSHQPRTAEQATTPQPAPLNPAPTLNHQPGTAEPTSATPPTSPEPAPTTSRQSPTEPGGTTQATLLETDRQPGTEEPADPATPEPSRTTSGLSTTDPAACASEHTGPTIEPASESSLTWALPDAPAQPDWSDLPDKIAAYRAGYLAEDRRLLEKALRSGTIMGLATTNALELGVDVSGLDAVLIAGWPGTRASLWQQAGRAGRDGQDALAVLIARDDPLDTYLVHHPQALFGQPVEAIVLDPDNPYVLGPHLCAAAAEIPLTDDDLPIFGTTTSTVLDDLVSQGLLRRRPAGWFWTKRERATDLADIRGGGGAPIQVVESSTGRLLGSVDEPSAHTTVHTGAVYIHQGETFLVELLDLEAGVALVSSATPDFTTFARDITDISILATQRSHPLGPGTLHFGEVEVTRQVVSYLKRRLQSGEMLGDEPLDLPPRTLRTRAVWWTLPASAVAPLAEAGIDLGGAAHAAEHASIGLLPLFATCDRWDIGGVSTELHADTGLLTVFVYDGHEGGAGFAERGYARAADWLTATREAITSCECERGCPSCIQSPKCGNGNEPLDKRGAVRLLNTLLSSQ